MPDFEFDYKSKNQLFAGFVQKEQSFLKIYVDLHHATDCYASCNPLPSEKQLTSEPVHLHYQTARLDVATLFRSTRSQNLMLEKKLRND